MTDETNIPTEEIGTPVPATEPVTTPTAAPVPAPQPSRHAPHWLVWLIIALGALATLLVFLMGVRLLFGAHHMMGVGALRHGYFRGMPLRRGAFGMRGRFGLRRW